MLPNLSINDLELDANGKVGEFAEIAILFRIVRTKDNSEELQKDLSNLGEWATKWKNEIQCHCQVMYKRLKCLVFQKRLRISGLFSS